MKNLVEFSRKILLLSLISMLTTGVGTIHAQGNINITKNKRGIIANNIVEWNGAPVIIMTPNRITNDIKKLINS